MSVPIKYCILIEAINNEETFQRILPGMKRNLELGRYTIISCDHDPHCRHITAEEQRNLMQRFKNE